MEKKRDWFKVVLVVLVLALGAYAIINGNPASTDELSGQNVISEAVTQPLSFTAADSVEWTATDSLFVEFDGYRFLKGFRVTNVEGAVGQLGVDSNLVLMIALANSEDKGIRTVLEAFGIRVSDARGKQLFP